MVFILKLDFLSFYIFSFLIPALFFFFQQQSTDDYFFDSVERISFFFEGMNAN